MSEYLVDLDAWMKATVALTAFVAAVGSWIKWVRPRIRAAHAEARAVRDAILGRDELRDSITGRELAPALPGVGERMATVEDTLKVLADQHTTMLDHGSRIERVESRLTTLEEQATERLMAKTESVAAWQAVAAVANQDVDDSTPPPVRP